MFEYDEDSKAEDLVEKRNNDKKHEIVKRLKEIMEERQKPTD